MAASEQTKITFRVDPNKVDRLDDLIIQLKARGVLDRDLSRSELLRQCMDKTIEELEQDLQEAKRKPAD
jgi:hypothetical protein